jgi:glycosyltransferase involved in cell wall biosynthesis
MDNKTKRQDMESAQFVSIAMCTYNGAKYIHQQLDSLLSQTYHNFELIIVDDSSKDNTVEILREYESQDQRIKIYENEKNVGFIQNFSKAISLCNGDFIALADQDDIWKKEKIELFMEAIGDNVLIYSDAILIDEYSHPKNEQLIRPENQLVSGRCNKAFLFMNCVSGNTLMFKKELSKYILPIPTISYHDVWIAYVASSIGTITYTDEAMIYYRRHVEQVTLHPVKTKNFDYFKTRIQQKTDEKMRFAQIRLIDFSAYRALSKRLGDKEMSGLLDMLIDHYQNYRKIIINVSLRNLLIRYKDEIFAIAKSEKRAKRAKRAALGLKYYLYTFFLS